MDDTESIEVIRFKELAERIPDIRQDKIKEMRKRIKNGEYKIDAKAVASKMIDLYLPNYYGF